MAVKNLNKPTLLANPTGFYIQQFDMKDYDPKIHHFFAIFRALSDESRINTVNPYEIKLMNAYSVHTPMPAEKDGMRTFIRLEFSRLKFDRGGNSVTPHFGKTKDYPFTYVPRPIPKHLFVPPEVYSTKPITNEDYSHESINSFARRKICAFFKQDDRYKLGRSDYTNLEDIANGIENERNQCMVFSFQGKPHGFCLYKIEDKVIKLDTMFTFTGGKGQEFMIYAWKILNQLSEKLAVQAGLKEGSLPITLIETENNHKMMKYFLRAARVAKVNVNIERMKPEATCEEVPAQGMSMS